MNLNQKSLLIQKKKRYGWFANQMAILFNKDEKTIRKHKNNIFKDGELVFNNNLLICIHSMR